MRYQPENSCLIWTFSTVKMSVRTSLLCFSELTHLELSEMESLISTGDIKTITITGCVFKSCLYLKEKNGDVSESVIWRADDGLFSLIKNLSEQIYEVLQNNINIHTLKYLLSNIHFFFAALDQTVVLKDSSPRCEPSRFTTSITLLVLEFLWELRM